MDFGLSDEQRALQDVFRSYLAERVPVARVREVSEAGAPAMSTLWSELVELGAAGVLIPRERKDIADKHVAIVRKLRKELHAAVTAAHEASFMFGATEQLELTEEDLDVLRKLGYVR